LIDLDAVKKEGKPSRLKVTVISAQNLRNPRSDGICSPFVEIFVQEDGNELKIGYGKTRAISKSF
jgi:Ca2+-dependent lipid-binding protein